LFCIRPNAAAVADETPSDNTTKDPLAQQHDKQQEEQAGEEQREGEVVARSSPFDAILDFNPCMVTMPNPGHSMFKVRNCSWCGKGCNKLQGYNKQVVEGSSMNEETGEEEPTTTKIYYHKWCGQLKEWKDVHSEEWKKVMDGLIGHFRALEEAERLRKEAEERARQEAIRKAEEERRRKEEEERERARQEQLRREEEQRRAEEERLRLEEEERLRKEEEERLQKEEEDRLAAEEEARRKKEASLKYKIGKKLSSVKKSIKREKKGDEQKSATKEEKKELTEEEAQRKKEASLKYKVGKKFSAAKKKATSGCKNKKAVDEAATGEKASEEQPSS